MRSTYPSSPGSAAGAGRCLDLARYMVAELANNVWSDHLMVTVAGFAEELVAANPTWVAHTADAPAAAQALTRIASENREVAVGTGVDVLEGCRWGAAGDVWMPQVLLAAPGGLNDDADLQRTVGVGGRAAVAVVLAAVGDSTAADRQIITVTEKGRPGHLTAFRRRSERVRIARRGRG
jgi:hypothetical protein